MNNSQRRRLVIIAGGLVAATFLIVGRLAAFQLAGPDISDRALEEFRIIAEPERGTIYDRHGTVLAANSFDYAVGVSPNLVYEPEELATALAPILQLSRYEILGKLEANSLYELLDSRVPADVGETIRDLPYDGIQLDPLPRRAYPQGESLCHTLGYVDYDGNGGAGVEGYYQDDLAGDPVYVESYLSPLKQQAVAIASDGADLILTIDRTVQYTVERHLQEAVSRYGAVGGQIIVMDPRTGALLAMASTPCFDPERFYEVEPSLFFNPLVSKMFEPGSVIKLVTMAAALDSGTVSVDSTYVDNGALEWGGHTTVNWDRSAPGIVDMTTLLSRSLNVGAATLSTTMGQDTYYDYMRRFGFGKPTGVDIMSEAPGLMPLPGDPFWIESMLATNAYGQGLAVTPLQMINAVAALANNGRVMQPYVVEEIRGPDTSWKHKPTVVSAAVSPQTANEVANMAITAVSREVYEAQVPGFTIAGKTGTAQIAENGVYLATDVIGSFVGWLPADDPEIVVFVKIDRPSTSPWGSQTAAPAFSLLAEDLVVLLDIPPDEIRLQADVQAARSNN